MPRTFRTSDSCALPALATAAMLHPMSAAPTSSLLEWFATNQPERTHRAGELIFVDLEAAGAVIDRAESASVSIRQARGFAVADNIATPLEGQTLVPAVDALLDCETPSGASCGLVRRTLRSLWAQAGPATGRHMVLFDFDDASVI